MRTRVALVVFGLLVVACTGKDEAAPTPSSSSTSSTIAVDRSGIALPGVAGETTTTIATTGTAHIVGTVAGPDGLVPGATVRVERVVGSQTTHTDVVTGPDGRFDLPRVPGGRYRVRAFLPPTLAQTTAEVRFLSDGDEHTFDLRMEDQRGLVVVADTAPDAPLVDAPVNLVVVVAIHTVDADGLVRTRVVSGATVELTGLGRWVLADQTAFDGRVRLDANGRGRWELHCLSAGASGLALRVPVAVAAPAGPASSTTTAPTPTVTIETVPLDLPDCQKVGETTTTTSSPDTTEP